MANEIIDILEYLTNNPVVHVAIIAYAIVFVIIFVAVIAIFAVVVKSFFDMSKRHRRR